MPHDDPSRRPPTRSTGETATPFSCSLHVTGRGAAWVSTQGDLDLDTAPELARILDRALQAVLLVVVDLRELTFIDSSGIRVVLEADERAHSTGHRLVLIRGPEPVERLLTLLGLTDRLDAIDVTAQSLGAGDESGALPAETSDGASRG